MDQNFLTYTKWEGEPEVLTCTSEVEYGNYSIANSRIEGGASAGVIYSGNATLQGDLPTNFSLVNPSSWSSSKQIGSYRLIGGPGGVSVPTNTTMGQWKNLAVCLVSPKWVSQESGGCIVRIDFGSGSWKSGEYGTDYINSSASIRWIE